MNSQPEGGSYVNLWEAGSGAVVENLVGEGVRWEGRERERERERGGRRVRGRGRRVRRVRRVCGGIVGDCCCGRWVEVGR